jgi:MacB-like periplasmic core domain
MSEEAARIPGVIAAGTISFAPLSGWGPRGLSVFCPGNVDQRPSNRVFGTRLCSISIDYFNAAGTRLLTGRLFSWHDDSKAPSVAIVNQTFAKELLGSNPAVGQRFLLGDKQHEIVGVVEDGKYESLTEDPEPTAFLAVPQYEQSSATLVVRSQSIIS